MNDSSVSYNLVPTTTMRLIRMRSTMGAGPLCLLALVLTIGVGGCAAPRKWKATTCYEGPPKALSDIAVVLLKARSLLVSEIRTIDGINVPDSVEYHLLPGTHSFVIGVSRGESKEMAITFDLRAGYVYSLAIDVWNLSPKPEDTLTASQKAALLVGFNKVECDWRPRILELGPYDELTSGQYVSEVVMQHIRARPLTFLILAKESVGRIDRRGECAHFVGVGNVTTIFVVIPVEMPAEHWGVWPNGWRTAREGERLGEPWPPRSSHP